MKALNRRLIVVIGAVAALAGSAAAQPVMVTGTGDPNIDVPAVQASVDQGGRVILMGHFSFDRPPTTPAGAIYARMVTVSKNVAISGRRDQNGDMPTIERGEWPFLVEALDAHVTIAGLRFVRPRAGAIWIRAVGGLAVTGCRVESIEPTVEFGMVAGVALPGAAAILVGSNPGAPSTANPGKPENFSGTLAILNNDIDGGATPGNYNLGIQIFSVGRSPDKEVDIYVAGNTIRNVNVTAIIFRYVGGRADVERNVLITGDVIGPEKGPDAIRAVGSGSYLIAHNSIDCGYVNGGAAGIHVFGEQPPLTPEARAIVVDNDVTMSAPEGTVFSATSAGIKIRGFAQGNSVLNNRIRGRANAALAVIDLNGGMPGNNTFVGNDLNGFQSSLADIFIDAGVTNTVVIGRQATIEDHGSGTVVVPIQ